MRPTITAGKVIRMAGKGQDEMVGASRPERAPQVADQRHTSMAWFWPYSSGSFAHHPEACLPHLKTLALSRSTSSEGQALVVPVHNSGLSHLRQARAAQPDGIAPTKQSNGWPAGVVSQQQARLCAAVRRPTCGQKKWNTSSTGLQVFGRTALEGVRHLPISRTESALSGAPAGGKRNGG